MAGPKAYSRQRSGTVRGRDAEFPSAPIHVSSQATPWEATPRSAKHAESTHLPRITPIDRPSTSGGTSSRRVVQKLETRDDLHLDPSTATSQQSPATYYNFPLPISLPTPATTPRTSLPRMQSPDFSEPEIIESNDAGMEIGMALGSPSHQPPVVWNPQSNHDRSRQIESPESLEQGDEWRQNSSAPKLKTSKWKTFGGLFGGGKKSTKQAPAFYQLQPERSDHVPDGTDATEQHYTTFPSPPDSTERPRTRGEDKPRTRGRTNTVSGKKTKPPKPDITRSQTVPLDFNFQNPPTAAKEVHWNDRAQAPEIRLDGGPMLNVDIPNVEMERYSIMFGSLLKPSNTTSSSLLARRQATLDKLKVVNEAIAEHERHEAEAKSRLLKPRRASSPQPTKSPAFLLFPTASHGTRARSGSRSSGSPLTPHRGASPTLHRSNTSPAALSPARQTFAISHSQATKRSHEHDIHEDDREHDQAGDLEVVPPRSHAETHTIMLAPTPPTTSHRAGDSSAEDSRPSATWSADESQLLLDSPSSIASDDVPVNEILIAPRLKPILSEPSWEMIPPHPAARSGVPNAKASSPPADRRVPARSKSERVRPSNDVGRLPSPLARNPSNGGASFVRRAGPITVAGRIDAVAATVTATRTREEDVQKAAEASIARQISVSRQQRQLLVSTKGKGGGNVTVMGERLVVQGKVMTPTLVVGDPRKSVKVEMATFERA